MKSKLGLHINGFWGGEGDWIERAKPQVLVSLDHNPDRWRDLRAKSPNTFIIGRYAAYDDGDTRYYPTGDGDTPEGARQKAENFFNAMCSDVEKMRGLYDAWVGINEPVCHTNEHAENLSAWHERWGDLMKSIGVTSVAYTFSQGVPEKGHWVILAKGLEHCDLLGLHEYWCPHWNSPNMIPWHTLRYRTAWEQLPDSAKRPIVITECGADGGAAEPALPTAGWKKFAIEGVYLGDLQAYDAELQKDAYVIGATIFSAGGGWEAWDVSQAHSIPAWIGSTGDAAPVNLDAIARVKPMPAKPAVAKPQAPVISPELLTLAQAHVLVQDAIEKLENGDGSAARDILVRFVTPWFYVTAHEHSSDLTNAQAHTAARWWCEEVTRQIEAKNLTGARDSLRDHVLSWIASPGPAALDILSVEYPSKPKAKVKPKTGAKKPAKKKASAKKATAQKNAAKKSRSSKPKAILLNAE